MAQTRIDVESKDNDGNDITVYLVLPDAQTNKDSQLVYNRAFRDALDSGAILRQRLGYVLEEQGIWDADKEAQHFELVTNINEWEQELKAGGISLEKAKDLAIQMRRARFTFRSLVAEKTSMDSNTVEGQADNARFSYLVYACLKDESGERIFDSFEDYENADSIPYVIDAAAALAGRLYGLDPNYDSNLPENSFLQQYSLVDKDLHLVDDRGRKIDVHGRYVDEDGRFIEYEDDETFFVDLDGKRVDADGNYLPEKPPVYLDEKGKPIPIPGSEPESEPEPEPELETASVSASESDSEPKPPAKKKTTRRRATKGTPTKSEQDSQG
ncbi:hypothetical protein CL634_00010 [bacterium]|nr:hypothetical protein [bacterium]